MFKKAIDKFKLKIFSEVLSDLTFNLKRARDVSYFQLQKEGLLDTYDKDVKVKEHEELEYLFDSIYAIHIFKDDIYKICNKK